MKYNYPKGTKCICGNDLEQEIKDWLDFKETIFDECQYPIWDDGGVTCEKCGREYSIGTGKMEVNVYINLEGHEKYFCTDKQHK